MRGHILEILEKYRKVFPQDPDTDRFVGYLNKNQKCTDRKNMNGHITVSALVVYDGKVVRLFQKAIGRWFQPGGHVDEEDTNLFDAIIREVKEETGLNAKRVEGKFSEIPLSLDIHVIPPNPKKGEGEHPHYDMFFLLELADNNDKLTNSDNGTEGAHWHNIDEGGFDGAIGKAVNHYKITWTQISE